MRAAPPRKKAANQGRMTYKPWIGCNTVPTPACQRAVLPMQPCSRLAQEVGWCARSPEGVAGLVIGSSQTGRNYGVVLQPAGR